MGTATNDAAQSTKSAGDGDEAFEPIVGPPYTLTTSSIIRMVYQLSPSVMASREEKEAAKHALEEFKANLSRLEPFVELNADAAKFPERRDAEGNSGELVAGVEKEMFDGAIIRLEGGGSASRFKFGEVDEGQDKVESGEGALIRARVEVPFVGSRRRQERVIAQAFQESTARKAELDYLSNYAAFVSAALSYYSTVLLYQDYLRAYERRYADLQALLNDDRVRKEDIPRIESIIGTTEVLRDNYRSLNKENLIWLTTALAIDPNEEFTLEEPEYRPSPYIERASTPEGRQQLLEEAYRNNPKFRVLKDAIADGELQRSQAIQGSLDITVFLEGTHFPFGSETFDDRVRGWEVAGGVRVRLNDRRVLTATRLKAEAQIRQFQAQIEEERLRIGREIETETERLRANDGIRRTILDSVQKKREDYAQRSRDYLTRARASITIDDVLSPRRELSSEEVRLASNMYRSRNAEAALMGATGEVYRLVGMKIDNGYLPELIERR